MTEKTTSRAGRQEDVDRVRGFLQEVVDTYQGYRILMELDPVERDLPAVDMVDVMIKYYRAVLEAVENGKPIAWHIFSFIPELLLAYGNLQPYVGEISCAQFAMFDWDRFVRYVEESEALAIPREVCSVNRSFLSPAFAGYNPAPTFIVTNNATCDSTVGAYQLIDDYFAEVPLFQIEMPAGRDQRAVDYMSAQLWDFIRWVEKLFGWKPDFDSLREIAKVSNETTELIVEINDIRKAIPCPLSGKLLTFSMLPLTACYGHPSVLECFKKYRHFAKEMLLEGRTPAAEEKSRVLWYGMPAFYDLDLFDWMQDQHGAVTVMDLMGTWPPKFIDLSTPESMIQGIAAKTLAYGMARQLRGSLDYILEDIFAAYQQYQIDCVIAATHLGCQHATGADGALRDALREAGIPALMFHFDCLDGRVTEGYVLRDMIKDFFEVQALPAKGK